MSKLSLEDAFQEFHTENPHVFLLYVRFADEALRRGRTRLSIAFLTERIRWFTDIETVSDDEFKINNNHRAFYARMLMTIPRFEGMFATREQKN